MTHKQRGRPVKKRGAHDLYRQEFRILQELSADELLSIGRKLGASLDRHSKPATIKCLLTTSRDLLNFKKYDNHPPELKEDEDRDEDLAAWAGRFLRQAEVSGEVITFGSDTDQPSPAGATVRMVCEVWQYLEWRDWLRWQQFGAPKHRGISWVADEFDLPWRWYGARMFLKNPWDFAFSHLLMATNDEEVSFSLHHVTGRDLDTPTKRWLAHAVLDGVRYDFPYDDAETDPIVIATPQQNRVCIQIGLATGFCVKGNNYKVDRRGFVWDTPSVRKRVPIQNARAHCPPPCPHRPPTTTKKPS